MKFLPDRTLTSVLLLAVLIAILVTLALVQYRWSGQVSAAEHERMQSGLMASMAQFRQQFNLELQELAFRFDPGPSVAPEKNWHTYAETCLDLLRRPENAPVGDIYLWTQEVAQLLLLNRGAAAFEPAAWPAALQGVRDRLTRPSSGVPGPPFGLLPWITGSGSPLLLRPIGTFQRGTEPSERRLVGFVIIVLSPEAMRRTMLPDLAQRYFAGAEGFSYRVAVIAEDPRRLIYASEPGLPIEIFGRPDARISLWMDGPRGAGPPALPGSPFPAGRPPGRPERSLPGDPGRHEASAYREPGTFPPDNAGSGWQLVARHPQGSLESAVATLRRRNLAVSFSVLLLLAVSMALIVVSARRAQRLAQMQMDFVAGVSHELRTPLAVISSAGDNLADGVVETSDRQVRKYGELVRSEARRLTAMVEQILQFGKLQRGQGKLDLRPAQLADIARTALSAMESELRAAGFSVEAAYEPNLPAVNVDTSALSNCIRNLVQNAVKYSGQDKRLSVRTARSLAARGSAVELAVADNGPGIEADDLSHVFDAFYRGRRAVAGQIHGTGLGLFMVREAIRSMGGNIRVESKVGSGTTFTMTFPAASAARQTEIS